MKKIIFFILICSFFFLFSNCKSKIVKVSEKKIEIPVKIKNEIAFIQVTDKSQMSFKNLPCEVFFEDGRIEQFKTDIEGKVIIKANPNVKVKKIIYNFNNYKRGSGRFLAKEDFQFTRKVRTKKNSKKQEFILNFYTRKNAKVILILDIF